MESTMNNGMCRCCASEGTFKDVKSTYHWMGEEEVYSEMLKECFDIALCTNLDGDDGGICEVCITQLRNAVNFKKQVLHTEEQFKERLQTKLFSDNIVKVELGHGSEIESDNDNDHDASGDLSDTEYEVPIKTEDDEPKARKRAAKPSTSKAKRAKKSDGETSKRLRRETKDIINSEPEEIKVTIKLEPMDEVREELLEAVVDLSDEKPKKVKAKGEVLERHRNTVREMLLCTNATPIRSKGGIGYTCCFCTKQFPDPKDLKTHNIEEHDDATKGNFMHGKDLSKFYVKLDITDLKCKLCKINISNIDETIEHIKLVHERVVFSEVRSQILPFKFDSEGLKCFVCENSFHSFRVLVEHMSIHYRNYICKVCDTGFVSQSILFQHAKTHKTGSFKCDYCAKIFETLLKKRAHERVVHTHTKVLNKCGYCKETFKDYWQREKHLAAVHGVSSTYKCQACDKTFTHQKGLRIHTKRDHLMERPHACTQCEMKFFTSKKLKEHMVKHTGLREFQCDVCMKCYGRKKTLNQHMRTHEGYSKFKCEHCGQGFVQKNSWMGHLRSKHGEQV